MPVTLIGKENALQYDMYQTCSQHSKKRKWFRQGRPPALTFRHYQLFKENLYFICFKSISFFFFITFNFVFHIFKTLLELNILTNGMVVHFYFI